ncbi:acyltransferase family protein [Burkholderia ubonensis]|uniref:acyltransferase family protein n=1 Tax=Burkholderia ubonensis TaxID=101571 RepID=UPI000B2C73D1|nr:acyltransferase family protein [Burkholderia ubonensis]
MRTARRYANASIEARRRSSTIASISETRSSVSGSQMPGERCSSRSAAGSAKPKIHSVGLMADYNLSKRTDVYLQAAYQHIAGDKTNSILDLSFPLLCIALRRDARLLAFWALVIAIGPVYRVKHSSDEGGFLYAYLACFDGIAIGCCAAVLADRPRWRAFAQPAVQWLAAAAMSVLYFAWPIAQSHVAGVTAMAFGTAVLLVGAHARAAGGDARGSRLLAPLRWSGRLSYELYLFHLVVLGGMRTLFPPRATSGDDRLLLLAAYLVLSAGVSAAIARGYATPLDRFVKRRWTRASARMPDGARV